ncbi:MAG: DNA alkylation repair protein [Bdellovibrionales bacterium]
MPELLKNEYSPEMISQMGDHLHRVWPEFDTIGFGNMCRDGLEALELKERIARISEALTEFLPEDNFDYAVTIMLDSLAPYGANGPDNRKHGVTGWGTLPMNRYISTHGTNHFDTSMKFFKEVTSHFSAEFDIRFFLIDDQDRTIKELYKWTKHPNYHVRRLVSEGTRPRLPWAMKLQSFIDNPLPILPLLEALKDDEEEYVRRSVANNLNDIAKDHPDLVAGIAKKWLKNADKNRERLVKHACRTLIKQGHKTTLETLGYGKPSVSLKALRVKTPQVKFGGTLEFEIVLQAISGKAQNLIIDYAIHHYKANGRTTPKVFKWKNITLESDAMLHATKRHAVKKITTRTYYNGTHAVEIFVNGVSLGKKDFELQGV